MVRKESTLKCGVVSGHKPMKDIENMPSITQVIVEISDLELGKML